MRCPTDGAELVMAERQGVEIDYCPSCRGIWLDRGELDKILDRAAGVPAGGVPDPGVAPGAIPAPGGFPPAPAPAPGYDGYREPGYRDGGGYRGEGYRDDRYRDDRYRDDRRYDDRRDPRQPYGKKKKRESWLGDLLDFD